MRLADADDAVLTALEEHLLNADIIEAGMRRAIEDAVASQPSA
jgi:hypothetical protein